MTTHSATEAATRRFPADVPLVVLYAAAVTGLVISGPSLFAGPLRVVVSLPLLVFLPGYAILAVLYPGRPTDASTGGAVNDRSALLDREGLPWGERAAVSFAASLALLPLLAVLLAVARVPMEPVPITVSLATVTVLGSVVGALRRLQLPVEGRLRLPVHRWASELGRGTVGAPSRRDALVNTVLLVAVVAALSGLAYGLAAPPTDGGGYTDYALVTDQGDRLVASNFTTEFDGGESASMVLTVENQEGVPQRYTAVVTLERVRGSGGNFSVVERQELTRLSTTVGDNETAREPHTIQPTMLGEDLRLSYYLYAGDAPDVVSDAPADEHLYLWVDVGRGAAGNESAAVQEPRVAGAA
ncbi:DUF1616 domain-containing protein [Halorarum halobium]|uniref:DUF1616 domain-containing protein n=1 Tax=Halorarum halobium TaxID=3075121 RepID=UPI0028AADB37|nr:DUF1616 domain-containing protein [Halobaculum sp. XH14]